MWHRQPSLQHHRHHRHRVLMILASCFLFFSHGSCGLFHWSYSYLTLVPMHHAQLDHPPLYAHLTSLFCGFQFFILIHFSLIPAINMAWYVGPRRSCSFFHRSHNNHHLSISHPAFFFSFSLSSGSSNQYISLFPHPLSYTGPSFSTRSCPPSLVISNTLHYPLFRFRVHWDRPHLIEHNSLFL